MSDSPRARGVSIAAGDSVVVGQPAEVTHVCSGAS